MSSPTPGEPSGAGLCSRGLWLGVAAMAMFGLTLPMTQIAIGDAGAPRLSPWFVTFGRAVVAAGMSAVLLRVMGSPRPTAEHWRLLAVAALGNAIVYPLLLAWALRSVPTVHAAVVTALAPLTTSVVAALMLRQRAGAAFWACAAFGCGLVVAYSLWRAQRAGLGLTLGLEDLWLALAVVGASIGYVAGARVTPALGAERVICWVTLAALPVTLPGALWHWPEQAPPPVAWLGFGYVSLFSMWIAFFAWYRALAMGDAVRVSQVQLLQPFFAMAFAWPLRGEPLEAVSLAFAAAVMLTVWLGRRWSPAAG